MVLKELIFNSFYFEGRCHCLGGFLTVSTLGEGCGHLKRTGF